MTIRKSRRIPTIFKNNTNDNEMMRILLYFFVVVITIVFSNFAFESLLIKQAFAQESNSASGPIDLFTENPTGNFNASGTISSLIITNKTIPAYVLSGHWNLLVLHEKVKAFEANFTMVGTNGTNFHMHSITNYRPDAVVPVILDKYGTTFTGVTDLKMGNNLAWYNVQTTVTISRHSTIRIMLNPAYIQDHFLGQPIYGVVYSILNYNGP